MQSKSYCTKTFTIQKLTGTVMFPSSVEADIHLIGWRSNIGGCSSANSMAVIPTAQISHCWLYPPFLSTAATSGAILPNTLLQINAWLFLLHRYKHTCTAVMDYWIGGVYFSVIGFFTSLFFLLIFSLFLWNAAYPSA